MSTCAGPGCTHPSCSDHRRPRPFLQPALEQHLPAASAKLEELASAMAEATGTTKADAAARIAAALPAEPLQPMTDRALQPVMPAHHALSNAKDRDGRVVRMLRTSSAVYVAPLGTPAPVPGAPLPRVWQELGALARKAGVVLREGIVPAPAAVEGNRRQRRAAARGRRGR